MRRGDDVEVMDAVNVEDRVRFDQRQERERLREQWRDVRDQWSDPRTWWVAIKGLVSGWLLWALLWSGPQWLPPVPRMAWALDLMRHLPRPPFL